METSISLKNHSKLYFVCNFTLVKKHLLILLIAVAGQTMFAQSVADYYQAGYESILKGDFYKAKEYFNKVLDLNPDNFNALYYRGIARGKVGDHEGAIEDFNKVIRLNREHPHVYYNRAAAKVLSGKIKQGCKDLKRLEKSGDKDAAAFVLKHCD
jgi:tetratricopeptide (TPR) repeat protein